MPEDNGQHDLESDFEEHKPHSGPWVAVVVVVCAVALGIWLVPEKQPKTPSVPPIPEPPAMPVAQPEPDSEPTPEPVGEAMDVAARAPLQESLEEVPIEAVSPIASRPGDLARQLIAQQKDDDQPTLTLDQVKGRADELQAQGRYTDAYLLYRYAARGGQGAAAMLLAEDADPAYHDQASSVLDAPDPAQAVKWYRVAERAGVATAGQRLATLRQNLQQAAAQGDRRAQRLLLQWQ